MEPSTSDAFQSRSEANNALHRRATVDSCFARPKPRKSRRPSLPSTKSVQFSPRSEMLVYDPPPSKSSPWYDRRDNTRFRRERMLDVLSFRGLLKGRTPPPSPCPVGLEQLLSQSRAVEAHSNREIVVKSVLVEQHRQRAFGIRDPEQVASLSSMLTLGAFERARDRAILQEMDAAMESLVGSVC